MEAKLTPRIHGNIHPRHLPYARGRVRQGMDLVPWTFEEFAKVLGFRSEQPWLKSAQTVKFADLGNSHLQEFAKVLGKREG